MILFLLSKWIEGITKDTVCQVCKTPGYCVFTYSQSLDLLYNVIGDNLILATGDKISANAEKAAESFLLKIQPGLSITDYRELPATNYFKF